MVTLPSSCTVFEIEEIAKSVKQEATERSILFDCKAVSKVDTSFIQLLLSLKQSGFSLSFDNPTSELEDSFEMMGVYFAGE